MSMPFISSIDCKVGELVSSSVFSHQTIREACFRDMTDSFFPTLWTMQWVLIALRLTHELSLVYKVTFINLVHLFTLCFITHLYQFHISFLISLCSLFCLCLHMMYLLSSNPFLFCLTTSHSLWLRSMTNSYWSMLGPQLMVLFWKVVQL